MKIDFHSTAAYLYDLPAELIAQSPCSPRDHSRLMLVDRSSGNISEISFGELYDFMQSGDSLVFNDTKVVPARLYGKRRSGGAAEILLTRRNGDGTWNAIVKPGKKIKEGNFIDFGENFFCNIIEVFPDGSRRICFNDIENFELALKKYGKTPLPHYIRRKEDDINDKENYQTVYAANPGAVAVPAAGLHFTEELLNKLNVKGVDQTHITLHVGMGTFKPVQVEDIRKHYMHSEELFISPESAAKLNARREDKRQICVGTTTCRALESAAHSSGKIIPGNFDTNIFIYPGYSFKYIQSLLTNFHLPGSTLLMLVSAFAGYELIREAYAKAIEKKFRFFSYGDAMLIF
jgi:S-adenosylmethionine:tRNA ribosyltransferase-isomerase